MFLLCGEVIPAVLKGKYHENQWLQSILSLSNKLVLCLLILTVSVTKVYLLEGLNLLISMKAEIFSDYIPNLDVIVMLDKSRIWYILSDSYFQENLLTNSVIVITKSAIMQ